MFEYIIYYILYIIYIYIYTVNGEFFESHEISSHIQPQLTGTWPPGIAASHRSTATCSAWRMSSSHPASAGRSWEGTGESWWYLSWFLGIKEPEKSWTWPKSLRFCMTITSYPWFWVWWFSNFDQNHGYDPQREQSSSKSGRQLQVLMKRSFIQWWRGSWQRAAWASKKGGPILR